MQREAKEKIIPVRFTEEETERIESVMEKAGINSRSGFIREAVNNYMNTVAELKVIKIRKVSKARAKQEILQYLKGKEVAEAFDIANDLRLEMNLTIEALKELWEEGKIK